MIFSPAGQMVAGSPDAIRASGKPETEQKAPTEFPPDNPGSPATAQHYTFTFDPIGNRLTYTGENPPLTTSYTSNNLNQYTLIDEHAAPDWSPSYDADGNVIQDDQFDYIWDAENRLASVTPRAVITGSKKCVFTYDYMGRRARKQVYTYSSGQWGSTPSTDIKCIYDGWNLILELNGLAGDAVLRKYTWGLDLAGQYGSASPSGIHGAGGIGGLLAMRDAATSTDLLYLYDANGNVGQLIKTSDGSFGAKYQYYPYGGEIQAVGTYATVNPFRFSTKYWDTEHQALYYGYRYHKPKLGRWLSRDPLQEAGGVHLYAHSSNDPINRTDPTGTFVIALGGAQGIGDAQVASVAILLAEQEREWYAKHHPCTEFLGTHSYVFLGSPTGDLGLALPLWGSARDQLKQAVSRYHEYYKYIMQRRSNGDCICPEYLHIIGYSDGASTIALALNNGDLANMKDGVGLIGLIDLVRTGDWLLGGFPNIIPHAKYDAPTEVGVAHYALANRTPLLAFGESLWTGHDISGWANYFNDDGTKHSDFAWHTSVREHLSDGLDKALSQMGKSCECPEGK